MSPKARAMCATFLLIAGVSRARADFEPFEAARNAVANYRLESRAAMSRVLCDADLVHWGGFASNFLGGIVDERTRQTMENVCTLIYAGKRIAAASIAYALLATPAGPVVQGLEKAVEVILDMPAKE